MHTYNTCALPRDEEPWLHNTTQYTYTHRHTSFNLLVVANTSWATLSSREMRIFSATMGLCGALGGNETSSVVFVLIFSASTGIPTYSMTCIPIPHSTNLKVHTTHG